MNSPRNFRHEIIAVAICALIALVLYCIAWASAVTDAHGLDVAPILWMQVIPLADWNEGVEHSMRDQCFADGGDWLSVTEDHIDGKVEVFCHKKMKWRGYEA